MINLLISSRGFDGIRNSPPVSTVLEVRFIGPSAHKKSPQRCLTLQKPASDLGYEQDICTVTHDFFSRRSGGSLKS